MGEPNLNEQTVELPCSPLLRTLSLALSLYVCFIIDFPRALTSLMKHCGLSVYIMGTNAPSSQPWVLIQQYPESCRFHCCYCWQWERERERSSRRINALLINICSSKATENCAMSQNNEHVLSAWKGPWEKLGTDSIAGWTLHPSWMLCSPSNVRTFDRTTLRRVSYCATDIPYTLNCPSIYPCWMDRTCTSSTSQGSYRIGY